MKTNSPFKTFKFSALSTLIVAITIAILPQPVRAQASHSIVLTENSSTSLTATYDGSASVFTVRNNGPDSWQVFASGVEFSTSSHSAAAWTEPESSLANTVFFNPGVSTNFFSVSSDATTSLTPNPDESTVANVVIDEAGNGPVSITFDDDAATAEVPDTGSTLGLLALALAALFGANRLRSIRLA